MITEPERAAEMLLRLADQDTPRPQTVRLRKLNVLTHTPIEHAPLPVNCCASCIALQGNSSVTVAIRRVQLVQEAARHI
jgi:hypothetical protein